MTGKNNLSFWYHFRTQASISKFLVKYPGSDIEINYTENILRNVLTCGLTESEIQLQKRLPNDQLGTCCKPREQMQPIPRAKQDEMKSPTMNTALTVENMDMVRVLKNLGQTHVPPMAQTVTTLAEQTTLQPCTAANTNQSNCHYSLPEQPSSRQIRSTGGCGFDSHRGQNFFSLPRVVS